MSGEKKVKNSLRVGFFTLQSLKRLIAGHDLADSLDDRWLKIGVVCCAGTCHENQTILLSVVSQSGHNI